MGLRGRLALCVIVVIAALRPASAGRIVIAETHAESDLADEAGGFTLLLRAALDGHGRVVLDSHALRGVVIELDQAATLLNKLDAEVLIACDLERDGAGLRASVLIVDRTGTVGVAASIRAGDGDLTRLVAEATLLARPLLGDEASVRPVSFGQVRPFVRAAAALRRGDVAAAAYELDAAESVVPLKVPSIGVTLAPGWAGAAVDQQHALAIALAAGTPQDVFDVAQAATPRDRAARAIAQLAIADIAAAARELGAPAPDEPLMAVAAARLAWRKGQPAKVVAAVEKLLARPAPYVPALVLVAELPPGMLPAALEDRALAQARGDARLSRLASVLGLRAAQRGGGAAEIAAAFEAIRVADLDDAEVARLTPIVARLVPARARSTLRLAAELAARRGDTGAVTEVVADWLGVAADDPAAQLWRGRLAIAAARLDEARVAFAAAGAQRELARVAIAANDWPTATRLLAGAPDDSAEKQVVAARLALSQGDPVAARAAAEAARKLAPASAGVLTAHALALAQAGDPGATRATELAKKVAPPAVIALELDRPPPPPRGGKPVVANAATLDEELGAALTPLVAALPLPAGGTVALLQLPSPSPGWFSLREAHPRRLRAPLEQLLVRRGLTVVPGDGVRLADPLGREQLDAAATRLNAAALVLYQVTAVGESAHVRLVAFDRAAGAAHEAKDRVPGTRHGLVGWNRGRLQLGGVVLAVLLIAVGFLVLRGRSRIVVELALDPDGSDEALCIEVSRSPARPQIGDDAARFRKDTRKAGHEVTRRTARLAGPRTVFPVTPGTWFVHVYGAYVRDYHERVVPPLHSKKLEVGRGETGVAAIDLGLPVAEVKVTIHDARRAGVAVWLDSELADKVYTDADGHATLYATVGSHTLCIDAHDLRLERPLPIAAAQLEKVIINLPRERRLAEVSEGLTLGLSAHGPAVAPVHDEPSLNSRVLGRYRIDAELGRGAMGVVFKAWDEHLERAVAIKVLARAVREIPQAMTLFVQEAKALAQLNHPNIVAVHDQATDGADTYLIMEMVDGTTVDRLLTERGKLPLRTALGVIDQLCSGLAYAHARKVIHRDIKPANVFVSREKVVKLGDFGIARVMRELEIRQTDVRGTPLYMSPEQINGANINHRADLYAVGCTLFELCCGHPPFTDGNVMAHHLFTEPPSLSSALPGVPPALDDLVAACLVKDATLRIATATEIQDRIRAIATSVPR